MRYRPRPAARLVLLTLVVLSLLFGGQYLVTQSYPLRYREALLQYAQEYGLDPFLVAAVIRTESRFRSGVTSAQGARGLMQIMPETGQWIARQMGIPFAPELLYDPEYNIRVGCWYLADLLIEFKGDTVLALAAYNAGRTNVQRWLSEQQWSGEHEKLEQIPFAETRYYVAGVLRDYQRYKWIYAITNPALRGSSR